ncbi:MAG: alkaline phosphatase family protein [Bryobacteraceae bacterium]|jgi:phospholipase C
MGGSDERLFEAELHQQSRYWAKAAYFLTYDEGGGFFDHVVPPVLDAYGAGFRVPTWSCRHWQRNRT